MAVSINSNISCSTIPPLRCHFQLINIPIKGIDSPRFSLGLPISRWNRSIGVARSRIGGRSASLDLEMEEQRIASGKMVFQPILEAGVFRFDCTASDRSAVLPSLSFADPKAREKSIEAQMLPEFVPTFERCDGQQTVTIQFPSGTSFYGTGEVSGPLERTGKRIFTWNTDAWGFGPGTTSLYQSHPWVLAVLPDGKAFGILADTTRRCEIDLRIAAIVKFVSAAVYPIITFGPCNSPTKVLMSLSHAIGTIFMPPKWSLGYHQCRWSYESAEKVKEIARTFRDKGIPCDVIWMDIDYMDGFRCFTFDKEHFSDPESMVNDLHARGFKAIWMLDPGIKMEDGYFVYESGSENNVWIKKADGEPFVGEVWPGPCVFPDFTQQSTRLWWANLVKDFISNGVDGIWNDMNEPAVFKTVTKTMPVSNIHRGDPELGGCQNHFHYHNVYGMLMARSTQEGMKMANSNKRPFVLTRAGFIGSQRYAATWTGDNLSNWEHLHMSLSMVLQLGLSGQPYSGPDIGGFAGNATPKLFGRWMGLASFFPFCRGHSEKRTADHEPWSFGVECEEICRLALLRRYRLLPHIYTLFYLAHTKGTPVTSPVFFADSTDAKLRNVENSFLLGPLLICARIGIQGGRLGVLMSTMPDQGSHECACIMPKGIWQRFDFNDSHPDLPSLYLRGGSILPVGQPVQYVGETNPTDELSLLISLDENGKAEGVLYEDDGDGYGYTQGNYLLTYYSAEIDSSNLTVKVSKSEGSYRRPKRPLLVKLLLGGGAMIDAQGIDGEELHLEIPSESQVVKLVLASEDWYRKQMKNAKNIPSEDGLTGQKGFELSKTPVELKSGDWALKVVPWIGGRIVSMNHLPSGTQWLHSRVEIDGYEEYSGIEYRSAGCSEEYKIIGRDLEQSGEEESLGMEGDIGGGLIIQRIISIVKRNPKILRVDSSIIARNVGAGSGGFSRLVCLRIHPTFTLLHPTEVHIAFTSIDGSKHEIFDGSQELSFEGNNRPDGEWMLVDRCAGLALVNRFDLHQVNTCMVEWGAGTVNLELWSEERPVSIDTPLEICHEYEVRQLS
ncbi:alpha-glucosidase 2-like isoform X2 [Zingiber officinale]|uniref:alpha-glucosidase 2-like isoform X2 n=1 Tax=Zingiber officinale TaxID=94328 RepID=UPI001C4C8512|nr:alpha-glucosidase 2-like isoform X2 [Zingiber officinale]